MATPTIAKRRETKHFVALRKRRHIWPTLLDHTSHIKSNNCAANKRGIL